MDNVLRLIIAGLLALCASGAAWADDGDLCRAAIGSTESSQRIPDAFLAAIGRVESGRPDKQTGNLVAWPWTINAEGVGSFYATKAEAVEAARALLARGVRSIDVGCLQINLLNHPDAFGSLEQAFDPATNADFAGRFLISLFEKMGSWPLAAAAYHSQTPGIGAAYQRKVLAEWATPEQGESGQKTPRPAPRAARPASGQPGASGTMMAEAKPPLPPEPGTQSAQGLPAFGHTQIVGHAAPAGGIAFTGRSLAAYRLMPTALALRVPSRKSS